MGLLIRFFGTALAVLAAAYYVPGFHAEGFYVAAIVALVLGVLNITIKPILLILTLPLNLLTLGLFTFIINALLLWVVSPLLHAFGVVGFSIDGFIPALWGSLIITVVNWILHKLT
jgi:putative membrane protein